MFFKQGFGGSPRRGDGRGEKKKKEKSALEKKAFKRERKKKRKKFLMISERGVLRDPERLRCY